MLLKAYCIGLISVWLAKAGCEATPQQRQTKKELQLTVFHYKVPCVGEGVQLCYRMKKNGGETEFFYDAIQGFEYEWGYNYALVVEEKVQRNQVADASALTYHLKKVVRKEKVAPEETFELPLQLDDQRLVKAEANGCRYFDELHIDTGAATCAEVMQANAAVFRHNSNKPGLVLVSLK